jgi:hypothetical protein
MVLLGEKKEYLQGMPEQNGCPGRGIDVEKQFETIRIN